jgi:hypothetical protein
MEPITVPKLVISLDVEIEVEYNSFGGKTTDEIADALQDEIHDLVFELDQVTGVTSHCTSIAGYN